jgi:D-alanyl-D-alanine carboxypeptidase
MERADVGGARIGRREVLVGAAALGMGALVAGCTSAPAPSAPAPGGTAPQGGGPLPEAPALREQFDRTARELLVPGAAMLVGTPDGELTTTYGTGTVGGSDPVTLSEHTRIGSVTKTFTGAVILQQAQEGKLDIDGPVAEHRPDVPNGRTITLAQLLNMRSGLYNYTESREINESMDRDPARVWRPDELLAIGYKFPPYFPPGTDFHYSNTNTVLLGLIAEQVDKQPLAEVYRTRLFTPLGLRETSLPDSAALPDPHPHGYRFGTYVSTFVEQAALPDELRVAAVTGTLKPNDVTNDNPSWAWAAGALVSTIPDLAIWARALVDGSLLNPTWQRRLLDSVQPVNQPLAPGLTGYGFCHHEDRADVRAHRHDSRIPDFHRLRPRQEEHPVGLGQPERHPRCPVTSQHHRGGRSPHAVQLSGLFRRERATQGCRGINSNTPSTTIDPFLG